MSEDTVTPEPGSPQDVASMLEHQQAKCQALLEEIVEVLGGTPNLDQMVHDITLDTLIELAFPDERLELFKLRVANRTREAMEGLLEFAKEQKAKSGLLLPPTPTTA